MNETASFKCNLIKKTIILFVYSLFVFIFLFLSISTSGLITLLFCTLFVIVLFIFIDTLLFQELIVTKNEIIKRWLIGHIEIKCSDLKVSLSKRLFTGKIMFIDTSKIFLHSRLMIIETFLFSNDDLKKIKEKLISNKIIKGDEYEWNF
ncbi:MULTISPECIES: hypothetical protein [Campylobacter]|uniref:Uncharacterized protein n=2 Tax=Campylobacter TaxID=194 RepID=A0A7H9CHJ7_9BACT|nr:MULTISPECIES: hypothetical protein [Campylobacter]MCI7446996.1 hypothetical protein [Campylobacter sp.]MCI7581495.1 hypothetical protein [Campylobacter sp.]QLI05566.1 hypothetical protein CINF_1069 [Candidatus Campylobacter infans]